jgi:hypothetical protein
LTLLLIPNGRGDAERVLAHDRERLSEHVLRLRVGRGASAA